MPLLRSATQGGVALREARFERLALCACSGAKQRRTGRAYDERTDRVLDGDVSGARLEPREKRGKATRWHEPVHGGNGKEQDTKKSGDLREGSVHKADVGGGHKFSVTLPP
jgi:hypothetical protein